jgi:arsenical pump membrane protein
VTEALALVLLALTLGAALLRPRGMHELWVAGPAAVLAVALGALSPADAADEARELGPTLGFLAAMLVVSVLCDRAGLFTAAGAWMARAASGRPVRLLALVFALAAGVTAVLSLDATVVLLTPIVYATATRLRLRPRPHAYACVHLANSASLLLPVSNLSNLLAFEASGLSFVRFGALMALPWLAAIAVEWAVLRVAFAGDLRGQGRPARPTGPAPPLDRAVVAVLAVTLAGFLLSSLLGIAPAVVAAGGAAVLAALALARGQARPSELLRFADVPFLLFVLALGIVVQGAARHGLGELAESLLPSGAALPALLGTAALAAMLANVVNNLPAILLLLPALGAREPGTVLAALIGVNVGPNLTYVGSLATLLWRRVLRGEGGEPDLPTFLRVGAISVPLVLLAAVCALWVALRL